MDLKYIDILASLSFTIELLLTAPQATQCLSVLRKDAPTHFMIYSDGEITSHLLLRVSS